MAGQHHKTVTRPVRSDRAQALHDLDAAVAWLIRADHAIFRGADQVARRGVEFTSSLVEHALQTARRQVNRAGGRRSKRRVFPLPTRVYPR